MALREQDPRITVLLNDYAHSKRDETYDPTRSFRPGRAVRDINELVFGLSPIIDAEELAPLREIRRQILETNEEEAWSPGEYLDALWALQSSNDARDLAFLSDLTRRARLSIATETAGELQTDLWETLGNAYREMGQEDLAREAFLTAGEGWLVSESRFSEVHTDTAWALLSVGAEIEAQAYLFRSFSRYSDALLDIHPQDTGRMPAELSQLGMLAWATTSDADHAPLWHGEVNMGVLRAYSAAARLWTRAGDVARLATTLDTLEEAIETWESDPPPEFACGTRFYRHLIIDFARQSNDLGRLRHAYAGLASADDAWSTAYQRAQEATGQIVLIHCRRGHSTNGWESAAQILLENRLDTPEEPSPEHSASRRVRALFRDTSNLFGTCDWGGTGWPCSSYADAVYASVEHERFASSLTEIMERGNRYELGDLPISSLAVWALGAARAGHNDIASATLDAALRAAPHGDYKENSYLALITVLAELAGDQRPPIAQ